jgi:hypothetical protein
MFKLDSPHKRRVGGKINECPDCVEELETETAVKYLGTTSEGSTDINIVKCKTEADRVAFSNSWKNGDNIDDTKADNVVQRGIDIIDPSTGTTHVDTDGKK